MKNLIKLVVVLLSVASMHYASAADVNMAKLKMKISGPVGNKSIYLCVSNNGCSNISAAAKGKVFMMDTGNVNYIFAANMQNLTMHTQPLPRSCKVKLVKDQTLTVSGKLIMKDKSAYINNLSCRVT